MSDNNIDWEDEDETPSSSSVPPPPSFGATPNPGFPTFNPTPNEVAVVESADAVLPENGQIVAVDTDGESEHVTVVQVDAQGNEVVTVVDMALPPLNREEAVEITEKIKGTTNLLYLLIKRAHAGKAYVALGYSSFEKYVREEFNYSRSYAYKLLNQATVIEAIESVVPEGTEVYVGELASRSLKHALPELVSEIEDRTAGLEPSEASQVLNDVIRDIQDRQNNERNFEEDYDVDDDSGFNDSGFNDDFDFSDRPGGGVGDMDFLDDDEEDLDQFLINDDPMVLVRRFENILNLITGLQTFSDLSETADLDELLPIIPPEKTEEITTLVAVASEWLESLRTKWTELQEQKATEWEENGEGSDDEPSEDETADGEIEY